MIDELQKGFEALYEDRIAELEAENRELREILYTYERGAA